MKEEKSFWIVGQPVGGYFPETAGERGWAALTVVMGRRMLGKWGGNVTVQESMKKCNQKCLRLGVGGAVGAMIVGAYLQNLKLMESRKGRGKDTGKQKPL